MPYRELLQLSAAKRGFTLTPDAAPAVGPAGRAAELARNLSAVLLEPLRPHLGEVQHLLLVPNGPLHRLPFAALPWDGGFLIQRFRLSTLSSASLLTALPPATSATVPHLVALADATPDAPLPEAAAEAQAIAQHFSKPDIYLHDQARRDRLLGQDLSGRILHLAVHGQASTPDRTRLRLSDGDLTYSDVTGLRLDAAPLVVLSACETGLGIQLSGDEVVSLANGFISAGARAVVSSLWPVPDPETKQLMQTFYDHRLEGHAAALAAAQRTLIAQSRDPYYWAGFVVGGW
ncbi:MAG: CHAT domain-containing protein [Candidatus Competibacter sp.]